MVTLQIQGTVKVPPIPKKPLFEGLKAVTLQNKLSEKRLVEVFKAALEHNSA